MRQPQHALNSASPPSTLWARIGHVTFHATGPPCFHLCEALSILTPFLTSPAEADWRITVSCCPRLGPLDGFSAKTEIRLFPSTIVAVKRHSDRRVWFEYEGMACLVTPASHRATLYLSNSTNSDVPRFGALMIVEILRHEQIHLVHAAAVERNGRATLIVAPSGGGKSTLACVWAANRTARLMADDRCFLWRSGRRIICQGVASPVGLFPISEKILSRVGHRILPQRALGLEQAKVLYDAESQFGPIQRQPTPIEAIVLLMSELPPDHGAGSAAPAQVHQALLQGGMYVGEPELMKHHFDLSADLVNRVSLITAPARPHYPHILDSLNRAVGGKKRNALKKAHRPFPDITAAQAKRCAIHLNSILFAREVSDVFHHFTENQWRQILKLAEYHGLLAMVAFELGRKKLLGSLSEGLRHVLTSAMRCSEAGRLLHTTMLRCIGQRLDQEGICWCVMKGPAIAERFFDPPAARSYTDLDIIIPFKDRHVAAKALMSLGFVGSDINHRLKDPENRGEWVLISHEPSRYIVELHWDYITGGSMRRFVSFDLTPTLERIVYVNVEGVMIPMTSMADQLLGCCVHATYVHGMTSLRHVVDIALIWDRCHFQDRETALANAAALGIMGAVAVSLNRTKILLRRDRKQLDKSLYSARLNLAMSRLVMTEDVTLRPWTVTNRLRGRLFRTALRERWI